MGRRDEYRRTLRDLDRPDWPAYLTEHSNLPGPRGNLELAHAVADEGDAALFDSLVATDDEYLTFCGALGLGQVLATSADPDHRAVLVKRLHGYAGDERWRVREAVATGLQRVGDADLPRLVALVDTWAADPDPLVARAAIAAICEPRLLITAQGARAALDTCERVTASLAALPASRRREPAVRTLRQALGYCWSVAVAADPDAGLPRFRSLGVSTDADVTWIVRQNERKNRLARLLQG